ncbi:glycosyltransferase family A protein [Paenibacillus aurantius]|uniref:Glycosyltransferase family A protein n=1 Tax=Paenibacillus aurantius TaxID=2918900 RepID=A0AA96RE25_9BACL|nr:glycosyltransferase family A protein [Paenibacillus aurantius]WNQ10422.1 glycosyltransferase family A protein [Paenibacillus aurantius]
MPKLSLVIPTLGRRAELKMLLESIELSVYQDFEVIIVDQNKDNLIDELCYDFSPSFPLYHHKVDFIGAAKARNFGAFYARGEILNFPDDDCEISPSLLGDAIELFNSDSELGVLYGKTLDKVTKRDSVLNFADKTQEVTNVNMYHTTIECTMFIRKNIFEQVGCYDEKLGVGTFYGAEENADLVLRLLYLNNKILYNPKLIFYHPQTVGGYTEKENNRAYTYGKGFGRLTNKHVIMYKNRTFFLRFLYALIRSTTAIVINIMLFKFKKAKFYYFSSKGRIHGVYFSLKEFM